MTVELRSEPLGGTDARAPSVMRSVACVVTAGASDLEAVRQAATVAEGGRLTLIDVHPRGIENHAGMTAASRIAIAHGVDPEIRVIHAPPAAPTLFMLCAGHDLLVVAAGAHAALDDLPLAAVRQAPIPVLVARPLPADAAVTERLLVATDGSADAERAMTIGRELAERHGSALAAVVPAAGADGVMLLGLGQRASPDAMDAVVVPSGTDLADAIVEIARRHDSTLLLVGSRGLSGIAALASVSARVAERAPCAVLVARPPHASRPGRWPPELEREGASE